MVERIRRLNDFQEGVLVVAIALGLPLYYSFQELATILTEPNYRRTQVSSSEYGDISHIIFDVLSIGLIWFLLAKRNWTFSDLNLNISINILFQGVFLNVATLIIGSLAVYGIINLSDGTNSEILGSTEYFGHKNYLIWAVFIVIESSLNEFIFVGYLYKKLAQYDRVGFVVLSAALRSAVYMGHGMIAAFYFFISGLVFGIYYLRNQQLTTLIIAHGLFLLWAMLAT